MKYVRKRQVTSSVLRTWTGVENQKADLNDFVSHSPGQQTSCWELARLCWFCSFFNSFKPFVKSICTVVTPYTIRQNISFWREKNRRNCVHLFLFLSLAYNGDLRQTGVLSVLGADVSGARDDHYLWCGSDIYILNQACVNYIIVCTDVCHGFSRIEYL